MSKKVKPIVFAFFFILVGCLFTVYSFVLLNDLLFHTTNLFARYERYVNLILPPLISAIIALFFIALGYYILGRKN
ncbi:MAG: hypothetical protein ACLPX5_07165 [Dissulfurispiraceae bacterium]